MNNFETVIGIEIHIELNTKTKMFSSAPNDFHAEPNTNASLIDMAYPGTLPVVNKEAVRKAIQFAKALKMHIDKELHFDRKNYFYADIPKCFQITQHWRPIGFDGVLPIGNGKEVSIERIQLEEDTARSNHEGIQTTLDYNRAGTPLIEIVSDPVIRSAKEAVAYVATIRDTVRLLGISDAKMEEGSLRADINISLRPYGTKEFGTKVEIKNLNSLSNIEKATNKEIAKQTKAYLTGEKILQSTKRFDESKQDVITMRDKSVEADYRFFAEPNIPVVALSKEFIDSVEVGDLPWEITEKLTSLGIEKEYINQLLIDPVKLNFIKNFENSKLKQVIKLFFAEIIAYINKKQINLNEINIQPSEIISLINKQDSGEISGAHVKKIIPLLIETEKNVETIIEDNNWKQLSDISVLAPMIDKIIVENKEFIDNNIERFERVFKFILGQLMKESKGQANPRIASDLVNEKLKKQ